MAHQTNIKSILIDDSPQARKLLRLMLSDIAPQVEICAEAEDLDQAVLLMKAHKPQLIFLDIEMPGKSGLQLLDELGPVDFHFEIIFTTAYNQFAINAFRLSAVDYLLKPIDEKQLKEAVEKATEKLQWQRVVDELEVLRHNLKSVEEKILRISTAEGQEFVNVNDIICIEADGSYSRISCVGGKIIIVSKNLKYFENTFLEIDFIIRPHRSFLINLQHMVRFDKSARGKINMRNGLEIDLARDKRTLFFNAVQSLNI